MTTRRPRAVIAHVQGIELFDERALAALTQQVDLADPKPIGRWDSARAIDLLAETEVVIGHWGCPVLDEPMLDAAPRLGLFAYAAGTVKGTVTDAVFERGIRVTSGARANAEPTAEFALAAILFANKGVFGRRLGPPGQPAGPPRADDRAGNWDKVVGIIGASLVGRRVIELLAPFAGLEVLLYDPYVDAAEADRLGVEVLALDDLCQRCDVLSIHAPDLPSTRHLVGARQLALLRSGATVVNTARPALVDQEALIAELESGRLDAVLDVTDPEPLPSDHVLRRLPNAHVTPHLAGSQGTELGRLADHVVDEIARWRRGDTGLNEITVDQLPNLA